MFLWKETMPHSTFTHAHTKRKKNDKDSNQNLHIYSAISPIDTEIINK